MLYLLLILASIVFLGGFLTLTMYEGRRGARFFPDLRYALDKRMARAGFIVEHVDWGAFMAHMTQSSLETFAHEIVHRVLVLVRALERLLTRIVRSLRVRREQWTVHGESASTPQSSRFERMVEYLQETLYRSRK
jgi:hypothetical protein